MRCGINSARRGAHSIDPSAVESGGDRVEVSERDGMAAHARTCLLGRDLQLAIGHGQLLLEYQPIFNLERMTVEGLEALLRWDHPVLGLVSPGDWRRG